MSPAKIERLRALAAVRVYLVLTRALCRRPPEEVLAAALRGGVGAVQVREKDGGARERLAWCRRVRAATRAAGALLIVNDRPDLAALCDADGVHVGQDDLTPADARRLVGPDALIGLSTHDLRQLAEAGDDVDVDYVGFGPCFDTATKGLRGLGLERVAAAVRAARRPITAIGGIDAANASALAAVGATAVAVSSAVCSAEDPRAAAAALRAALAREGGAPDVTG
ncbi:MAG TPA: thiamine phosphate synthase [Planctomycetota bacterium]|nr:thiamine phosphate synthase [Planctomycetota bacterium]